MTGSDSDQALIIQTLEGDELAFGTLVRRYLRKAMAVALEFADSRADAEDIVQDTFGRALENLHAFDTRRSFEPWLFTILRNTARNSAKRNRVRAHAPLLAHHDHPAVQHSALEQLTRNELRAQIEAAVDRLPPMQQSCFRLCLVEGFTTAEAATALDIAESTVRVHLFKARNTLQQLLAAWRDEVEKP